MQYHDQIWIVVGLSDLAQLNVKLQALRSAFLNYPNPYSCQWGKQN